MELSGRVVVVTGAASGIGLGMATRFVREGAAVIASDVNPAGGAHTAAGIGVRFVAADVSQEEAGTELVDDVLTNFMVTTHQATLDLLRAKATDYDGYISTLVQMRQHTLGSPDA